MQYVSEEAAAKAREFERRFQALPSSAGIIFVSVAAVPVEGGQTSTFDVLLGMTTAFEPQLGESLVKRVLEEEIEKKQITLRDVRVRRGVSGAASDRGDQGDARSGPH